MHWELLYGTSYICSATEMVFFDKCVTANSKNLRKYIGLAILINLWWASLMISKQGMNKILPLIYVSSMVSFFYWTFWHSCYFLPLPNSLAERSEQVPFLSVFLQHNTTLHQQNTPVTKSKLIPTVWTNTVMSSPRGDNVARCYIKHQSHYLSCLTSASHTD